MTNLALLIVICFRLLGKFLPGLLEAAENYK